MMEHSDHLYRKPHLLVAHRLVQWCQSDAHAPQELYWLQATVMQWQLHVPGGKTTKTNPIIHTDTHTFRRRHTFVQQRLVT